MCDGYVRTLPTLARRDMCPGPLVAAPRFTHRGTSNCTLDSSMFTQECWSVIVVSIVSCAVWVQLNLTAYILVSFLLLFALEVV